MAIESEKTTPEPQNQPIRRDKPVRASKSQAAVGVDAEAPAFSTAGDPNHNPFNSLMDAYSRPAGTTSPSPHDFAEFATQKAPTVELPHRPQLESAFGTDLGSIPVHGGAEARSAADGLHANAFQYNGAIVLGGGTDLKTVAEEVAHVQQYERGSGFSGLTAPGGSLEIEASGIGAAVAAGMQAPESSGSLGAGAIARSEKDSPEQEAAKQEALSKAQQAASKAESAAKQVLGLDFLGPVETAANDAIGKAQAAEQLGASGAGAITAKMTSLLADVGTTRSALGKMEALKSELTQLRACDPGSITAKVDALDAEIASVPGLFKSAAAPYKRPAQRHRQKAERAQQYIEKAQEAIAGGADIAKAPPGEKKVFALVRRQKQLKQVTSIGRQKPSLEPPAILSSALAEIGGQISAAISESGISGGDMLQMQDEHGAEIGLSQGADDSYGISVGTEGNVGLPEGHKMLAHTHPGAEDDVRKELPSASGGDLEHQANVQAVVHSGGLTMFGPRTLGTEAGFGEDAYRSSQNVVGVNTTDVSLTGKGGELSLTHNESGSGIEWDGQNAPQVTPGSGPQMPDGTVRHIAEAKYHKKGNKKEERLVS